MPNFNALKNGFYYFCRYFLGMNFIEELRWRGMLQDIMPGTEELLNKEMVSGYVGFDPTADSLHMGNMVSVLLLARLQKAGHKPYALVGGATGMIGDPSGKSQERNLLDEDLLRHNVECIKKQLSRFLDFENGENKAVLVNNYDWIKDFTLLSFLRDVGKHLTVNYMLSKDSVQKRLETGLSFTEFSYQLIQGYDFYHLYKNHGIKLQMGGSDQWGNIVSGTELIRRMAGGEAFAATAPLLTKADGTKFGKSEQGNIWIDANKTSPYKFYQFWLNVGDEEAVKLIKVFTFLPKEEIDALTVAHLEAPHLRILQKRLAEEVTVWIHSKEALQKAQAASDILFGKGTAEGLKALSESEILDIFEGVPQFKVNKADIENGVNALQLVAELTQIFPSKGEARRMFQNNGVLVNKTQVGDAEIINANALLNGKFILVQKGKKSYNLVIAE